jgi:rubrerythrin
MGMTFKELLRAAIHGEMQDISVFEADAEAFAAHPACGEKLAALLTGEAEAKRERLLELKKVTGESVGFRQRVTPAHRSPEAALRALIVRAASAKANYYELAPHYRNPEHRAALEAMAAAEGGLRQRLLAVQELLKKP